MNTDNWYSCPACWELTKWSSLVQNHPCPRCETTMIPFKEARQNLYELQEKALLMLMMIQDAYKYIARDSPYNRYTIAWEWTPEGPYTAWEREKTDERGGEK